MKIVNSTASDISQILALYETATKFQKLKGAVPWPKFSEKFVAQEVSEKRQWKIVMSDQIACVWAHTFSDPEIWGKKNSDPAIYIHRISTNPYFKGRGLVKKIVSWSKQFAARNNKKFIRMDTVGENRGLIEYYQACGFDFLGLEKLTNTDNLPAHYHKATVSLFELAL